MRISPRLVLALLGIGVGCTSKSPTTTDSGGDTSTTDTAGDTAEQTVEPVWKDVHLETSESMTSAFSSGSGLYVTLTGGSVELRSNGQWTSIPIDVDGEDLNGIWGIESGDDLHMVAVGNNGYVATWLNGGWSVQDIGTPNLLAVSGPDSDDLIAVGWGGLYHHTAGDTGSSDWTHESLDNNPKLNDIWYDGSSGFAVGEDGTLAVYDGSSWNVDQDSQLRKLYGVSATGPDDAWAVGEGGTVLHWDGSSWTESDSGHLESLWSVWAYSTTDVFAVGSNGVAIHFDGSSWSDLPTGVTNNLYKVTGTSANNVWAVGNRGMTLHYTGE